MRAFVLRCRLGPPAIGRRRLPEHERADSQSITSHTGVPASPSASAPRARAGAGFGEAASGSSAKVRITMPLGA
eukprot:6510733-Prymnesium_polylepis.1